MKRYRCTKEFIMNSGELAFKEGDIYPFNLPGEGKERRQDRYYTMRSLTAHTGPHYMSPRNMKEYFEVAKPIRNEPKELNIHEII